VVRGKAFLPGLTAGLLLIACAGCSGTPGPWTSRATFTISNDPGRIGPFTAADSTVPLGADGNAEIDLGVGLSPGTEEFSITIGDDPGQGTNVSQFKFLFPGYHGAGSYILLSRRANSEVDVSVRRFGGSTDTWSTGSSPLAACTLRVTADRATRARAIQEITGGVTCHRLYDVARHTRTAVLSGHFDVFAQVWCGGSRPTQPCVKPPPGSPEEDNE
jgi:hypothetical protein